MASPNRIINEKPLPMLQHIVKQVEDTNITLNDTLLKILSKLDKIEQNQRIMIDSSPKHNEDDDTSVDIDKIISFPSFADALKSLIKTKSQLKYAFDMRTIYEAGFDDYPRQEPDLRSDDSASLRP
jgi:hypothetical protein